MDSFSWLYPAILSLVIDWGQTRTIAQDPRYQEANVVMGTHPSLRKVDLYFVSAIAATYSAKYVLNERQREQTWAFITSVEVGCITRNKFQFGIKMSF